MKLFSVGGGDSFEQRNEVFTDYLQSGFEVRYCNSNEGRGNIVYLVDYRHPKKNFFHVVNQWTHIEHENKRHDLVVFLSSIPRCHL